jgi:hypothetical protein
MSPADCFRTLGLTSDASREEVRQAYLDLVRIWHPDRFQSDPHLREKAEQQLKRINEAYFALKHLAPIYCAHPKSSPHSPLDADAASPVPSRSARLHTFVPHPLNRWFTYAFSALAISLGAVILGVGFSVIWADFLQFAYPDPDLIQGRAPRPAILTPSRIIHNIASVSLGSRTLAAWGRGEIVDLWRPLPKMTEIPLEGIVNASRRNTRTQDGHVISRQAITTAHLIPINGAEIVWARQALGAGELRISNKTNLDAIATLVQAQRSKPFRAVYIQAHSEASIRQIARGIYDVSVELGLDWDPKAVHFRVERYSPERTGPLEFFEITSSAGDSGCEYDIVLKPL